jgi:sirohydrochlorin cobaltochelatase
MSPDKKMGIVLVSYGSLNSQAWATYEKIRSDYVKAFPGADVRLAFTSDFMRRVLLEKQGIFFHSPLTALAELFNQGCRNVVAQSLHVVPGSEFQHMASSVHVQKNVREKSCFGNLEIGTPLLSSLQDCMKVSKALRPEFQSSEIEGQDHENESFAVSEEVAYVLMGHGTSRSANRVYSQMAKVLKENQKNVFLGTLEGFPGIDEVLLQTKKSGVKKVILMPFLLVAGGHALVDLAGDSANSWRSVFDREGFRTEVILKGLGENDAVVDIFVEHTRKAVLMLKGRIRDATYRLNW